MKKLLIALSLLLIPYVSIGAVLGDGNVGTPEQFVSTSTPSSAITQRIYGKSLKLTGLTNGANLCLDSFGIVTTSGCSTGGITSATYPLVISGSNISTAFGTTTANTFSQIQRFGNASSTLFSNLDGIFLGRTATTTIYGNATSTFQKGINILGGCFSINGTCLSSGGGGGTPGGSNTDFQFNNSGSFDGADVHYSTTTHRTGFEVSAANALATIHADAIYGDIISPPASLSASLVLDTAIDRPTSVSASQIDTPADPNSVSLSFTYIDQPTDAGQSTFQNTGESGFTANCQNVNYYVYAYRMVGGLRVANPSSLSFSTFTDSICDGTTQFGLDIGGWTAPNGYEDGYILVRIDNTGTYDLDIGNVTSYNDTYFTNTDPYLTSGYPSSGTTWSEGVSQYKTISGTKYRTSYITNPNSDANVSGAYLIVNATWGNFANDGFFFSQANGSFADVGSGLSFDDYGQSVSSDIAAFTANAFPYFNTTLTGVSGQSDTFNYGSGSCTADGSSWTVDAYEYRTNPTNGIKYSVASPDNYNLGSDANDSSSFNTSGSFTPGDGDGRIIVLNQNGSPVGYQDIGGASSFSGLDCGSGSPSLTSIASYTGVTRDFSTYGFVTSPSLKYGVTHRDNSFTDNNPVAGYFIQIDVSGAGNATGEKTLQTINGTTNHITSVNNTGTFYVKSADQDADVTVTPQTVGYLANGSNLNKTYRVYSYKSSMGIYSSTYAQTTTTDPNNGLYYTVSLTASSVTGATNYKFQKVSTGYKLVGTNTLQDDTSVSWGDSSTVTPTQNIESTAIFDRASSAYADPAIVKIRNTTTDGNTALDFMFNQSGTGTYTSIAKLGTLPSGKFFINTGNVSNGGVDFGTANNTPFVTLSAGAYNNNPNTFNVQGATNRDTLFKGSSGVNLGTTDTAQNTFFFGATPNGLNYDPTSAVAIKPKDTSDAGLLIYPYPGASDNQPVFLVENSSATKLAGINTIGSGWFGTNSGNSNNARLSVGSPNSSLASMQFVSGANMPSTPVTGGLSFSTFEAPYATDGALYFTNNSSVTRRVQTALSTGEQARFVYIDGFGNITTLNNPIQFASGIITFSGSQTTLFANGFSVGAGKDVIMGSGSRYIGGFRTLYATGSGSATINVTNQSPIFVFTGSTAGRTITLQTAASINGTVFEILNRSTVDVTVNTTSSQTIYYGGLNPTSLVLHPGEDIRVVSDGSNWVSTTFPLSGIANTWTANNNFTAKLGVGSSTPTYALSVEGISSLGNQAIASFFTATSSTATSTFAGGFGQGTTTPMAFNAIYNASSMIARVVSQLIAGVQYVVEEIDRFGHLITSAPAPTLSSCGTSPTITGNDRNGTITTGSGISVTACTMTFANAYPAGSTVECTESTDSTVGFAAITSVSTTAVTFGLSASLASGHIYYICQAHQ